MNGESKGCPLCEWSGDVAVHHTRTHQFYTHVRVEDGTLVKYSTCSERTRTREETGLLARIKRHLS